MPVLLNTILIALAAYLIGSIPFALLITRWKTGVDLRTIGSGHAGATNTMRAAGWPSALAVAGLDIGKGYLAVLIARVWGQSAWAPLIAAGLVVLGHCWPVFANFRGGMGVASLGGGLLAAWPFGFALALGLVAASQLIIRHSARANIATGLLVGPLWLLAGASPLTSGVAAAGGVVMAVRSVSDWNRVYRELWLDREGAR